MKTSLVLLIFAVAGNVAAQTGFSSPGQQNNYQEPEAWQEAAAVEPPAFPAAESLIEFYVGAAATNKYFIDASTLAVGSDGVVRYVLVVKTSGGATNISFEGLLCKEASWKLYATGRSETATWTKSRAARIDWRPIEARAVNRHHAALSRDYFCPQGNAVNTADEGRNALRLGKHPNSI